MAIVAVAQVSPPYQRASATGCGTVLSSWLQRRSALTTAVSMLDAVTRGSALMQDPRINWIVNPVHKHRELRGLTSAGKKYRGLRHSGHATNKLRPSRRATWKRNNR